MGKSIINTALGTLSGGIDKWVYRQVNGRTLISKRPVFAADPSEAQRAVQDRFRAAAVYGNEVMADPARRAVYAAFAAAKKVPLYVAIVTDFLRLPVVDQIDLAGFHGAVGDPIRVKATDDCGVMGVTVGIRAADETVLEQGVATLDAGMWVYAATMAHPAGTPVSITATAVDRPGTRASKMIMWS